MLTPKSCDLFNIPFFQFAQLKKIPAREHSANQSRLQGKLADMAAVDTAGRRRFERTFRPAAYRTLV